MKDRTARRGRAALYQPQILLPLNPEHIFNFFFSPEERRGRKSKKKSSIDPSLGGL